MASRNGQQVHDNAVTQAITGGALDADEEAPSPVMIQGVRGRVGIRKLMVTPITGTAATFTARVALAILLGVSAPVPVLGAPPQKPPAKDTAAAKASEHYSFICQPCHGPGGKGVLPGADLTTGKWKHGSSVAAIAKTISEGVPGTAMLPAKDRFTKEEILALAKLVRSFDKTAPGKKPVRK